MKKLLMILSALVFISNPVLADEEADDEFDLKLDKYISVKLGATKWLDSYGNPRSDAWAVALGVGKELDDFAIRAELELSMQGFAKDSEWNIDAGNRGYYNLENTTGVFLLNGYIDLMPGYRARPYFSLGLGFVAADNFVDSESRWTYGGGGWGYESEWGGETTFSFASSLGAGVSVNLIHGFALDAGARFIFTSKDTENENSKTMFNASLGLRYTF
ncbi:MAG: outer membrane beta-barrel protein [Rickettsiales bacterium]|jgi:hypothetical protein|nr:outer membrane beta-barrel protein [Rickettsiales bacterium]